jgi:hypothetical protein
MHRRDDVDENVKHSKLVKERRARDKIRDAIDDDIIDWNVDDRSRADYGDEYYDQSYSDDDSYDGYDDDDDDDNPFEDDFDIEARFEELRAPFNHLREELVLQQQTYGS